MPVVVDTIYRYQYKSQCNGMPCSHLSALRLVLLLQDPANASWVGSDCVSRGLVETTAALGMPLYREFLVVQREQELEANTEQATILVRLTWPHPSR